MTRCKKDVLSLPMPFKALFALLAIFAFCVSSPAIDAVPTVKRLLILPAVNESRSADNAYIGPSLADAVRSRLAEQFFFIHPEAEAIEATQKSNFIQDEDLHTKSAALQMGEWLRQDMVLSGKYSVAANRLRLDLNLYEIETGKVLVHFRKETPLTANMFSEFNAIATELGTQMAQALPSQQELRASGGSYYDPERGKRTLLLAAGMRAAGLSDAAGNLSSSTTVSTADFPYFSAALAYQRHSVLDAFNRRYKWPVFAQISLHGGYGKRDYSRDGQAVPARLISGEIVPALGYSFVLRWFRLEPFAGFGLGYSNFQFDYSGLARKPVDTTVGQALSTQTLDQFYFLSQVGFIFKYALHPRWVIVVSPSATVFHFAGGAQAELNARMGVGFYF